jgi:hypothetical protein
MTSSPELSSCTTTIRLGVSKANWQPAVRAIGNIPMVRVYAGCFPLE